MLGEWMEREIRQQPGALRDQCESYKRQAESALAGASFDMALLIARGSSDNAALVARYWLEVFAGIPVSLAAPSVLTRYGASMKYPKCLAIGISQSGAAPDVAEVLGRLRAEGHTTVAITNTAGSRVTEEANHAILLEVGKEVSVAATKTFTASLLALYQIVRQIAPSMPDPSECLPGDEWLEFTRARAAESSGEIVRNNPVFSLGRGFRYGIACETALKLMECALIPCKSYSTADFEHGPKALAGCGSAVIAFGGALPSLAAQGCEIVQAPIFDAPEPLQPFGEVFFGQWLALTAARARGLNPDAPKHIRKVTETL